MVERTPAEGISENETTTKRWIDLVRLLARTPVILAPEQRNKPQQAGSDIFRVDEQGD
jgi:hypothetical protein